MKEPVLFIHVLLTELTASLIENLDDSIEEHFFPLYLVGEEVQAAKIQMVRKYSIRPLPNYKEMIKKLVTDDQYKGIMKQKHFQNRNKYYKEEA